MEDERVVLMSTKGYKNLIGSEDGKNLFWTTDINTELPIKMKQFGPGSETPKTLSSVFINTAEKQGEKPAFFVERGGKILKWSFKDYQNDVFNFAKAMHVLGIEERKCVNIIGHNAPEWIISFMGGIIYNGTVSGVYPTNNPEACLY
jgi:long-subunit acyl-CoA synthetase (AMP-forming)